MRARNRRVVAAVTVAGLQRVLQIGVTLITIPLILRSLGPAGFGLWAAATSLSWIGTMLDLGLGAALITLVAQGMAVQNIALVRDQFTAALCGTAVMAMAVMAVGGGLACATAAGTTRIAFLLAAGGIAVTIPLSLANAVWMGLQKGSVAGAWNIAQTVINLAWLLAVIFAGAGPLALVAAFYGSTLLAFALSLTHLFLSHPELRPARLILRNGVWRQILQKSALFAAISVAAGLGYALDNVLALSLLSPLAAARIAILLRIGVNATGLVSALTQPLWPAFTDAHNAGDSGWTRRGVAWSTAGLAVCTALGGAVLVLFGPAFLHLWLHDDLGIGRGLLLTIAIWIFGFSVPSIAGLYLNAMSVLKFQLVALSIASFFALLLKYLFARDFGVGGILLAAPVSWFLIVWPSYAWRLKPLLNA